jgi:hypothetical protein
MPLTKQTNAVSNKSRGVVLFEGQELCYNYKTDQWTTIPAYDGLGMYSVYDPDALIGLIRFSGTAVDVQKQNNTGVAQTAVLETAETDPNTGGRTVLNGIRPLVNGGTVTVRSGVRNDLNTTVSYSTVTSLNSRTGFANMRSEGKYHRAEITIADGFTSALGADVDFTPAGKV